MKKNISQTLLTLFKNSFDKDKYRWFREGDPISIPQSRLPALIVTESDTNYNVGPTGHDEIVHSVRIKVILNKKDEMGNPEVTSTLESKLDEYVQARDDTTGDFLPDTIMAVLRRQLTIDGLAINNTATVKKGVVPRPDDMITAECWVDISITEYQAIANRV